MRASICLLVLFAIAAAGYPHGGGDYRGPPGEVPPPGQASPPDSPSEEVELALGWLRKHQEPDGRWDPVKYWLRSDGRPEDGMGKVEHAPGVTALALLAFLEARYLIYEGQVFEEIVLRAGGYLMKIQDDRGCFGPRRVNAFVYNHAIATAAMVKLFRRTQDPEHKESARKGVDFILRCRNPCRAWRYGIRPGDNDTSVTSWMLSALAIARESGFAVPKDAFEGARVWIDRVSDQGTGRVGYTVHGERPARPGAMERAFPRHLSEAGTAEGIVLRLLTAEEDEESALVAKGAKLLMACLPEWKPGTGTTDMYYWYWGTRAMRMVGGKAWRKWKQAMRLTLLASQRRDDRFRGSWDAAGPWGTDGGRVYSTAIMILTAMEALDL